MLTTPRLIPEKAGLDRYRKLFEVLPFWRITVNSLVLALVSTALLLVTSSTAAYAFARLDFRGKNAVFVAYLATLMIPFQVLVVPLFIEMRTFDLIDTYAALIVPTIASAFGVFLLRQAVAVLPKELDEAAFVDGAGHFRIFLQIMLPLIRPALATLGRVRVHGQLEQLPVAAGIIRSPRVHDAAARPGQPQGQYTTQWNVVMAGSVVSIVPDPRALRRRAEAHRAGRRADRAQVTVTPPD